MIHLRPEEEQLLRDILATYVPTHEVLAFGSRVTGRVKPMSDLDLCIIDEPAVTNAQRARLADAFSESPLPFKVDVVYWSDASRRFLQIIEQSAIPFSQSHRGKWTEKAAE